LGHVVQDDMRDRRAFGASERICASTVPVSATALSMSAFIEASEGHPSMTTSLSDRVGLGLLVEVFRQGPKRCAYLWSHVEGLASRVRGGGRPEADTYGQAA
ncbi:hypothetical protein, partial [Streptomyces sp. DH12]|uniref:hypothetical protein n=1 Tax=Streptomyces sp. DH12 TaxID=2857010 RepID=UPI001E3486C7